MRENQFIAQNKNKWREFEEERKKKAKDPAKQSKLFIQITDDLSYARSFYKNRQVRYLLNSMAEILFLSIYKNNRMRWSDVLNFWTTTLPLAVYRSRKALLFSFCLFVLSFCIGLLSAADDPGFSKMILSDEYVDMTLQNIRNGDPMGVYKKMGEMDMMLGITLNNLLVSAIIFVLGIFSSLGTVFAIVQNGVMVGTFQYFFIERGLFWESFLSIWQHGTLEISAIIIAGGAGIVLGKGLLFPGSYTRMQAFHISGKRGLVIFAGIAPIIVFAAFIESFFTRYTELPDILRLLIILFSLVFIIFYFVIYPRKVAHRNSDQIKDEKELEYRPFVPYDRCNVHSGGQLFEAVLRYIGHRFSSFFKKIIWLSLSYIILFAVFNYWLFDDVFNVFSVNITWWAVFRPVFMIIAFFIFFYNVYELPYMPPITKPSFFMFLKRTIMPISVCVVLTALLPFIFSDHWITLLEVALLPTLLAFMFWSQHEKKYSIMYFFNMLKGENFKLLWLMAKFWLLYFLLKLLIGTPMFHHLFDGILWNFYLDGENMNIVVTLFQYWMIALIQMFFVAFATVSIALFVFNMKEKYSAEGLKLQIEQLGNRSLIKGFERE